MKKILLSLSILSLGLAQVPMQGGTDPFFAFEPEQRNMSFMAKCTLFAVIIAAAYGCNMLFKAWSGDQGKVEPKKDNAPSQQTQIAKDHALARMHKREEERRAEYRERRVLLMEQRESSYANQGYQTRLASADGREQQMQREVKERGQDRETNRARGTCSAAPMAQAPSQKPVIVERVIPVTQQAGDDCGLHAAYNATHNDQLSSAHLEEMRAFMRSNNLSTTALMPQDVFRLMMDVNPDNFTILPNVTQLLPDHGLITATSLIPVLGRDGIFRDSYQRAWRTEGISLLANALDNLRSTHDAQHAFIVGNALINYDSTTGEYSGTDRGAHWIAVRARNENGTIVLEVKDSQQGNSGTRAMIESLKKIIQETDTALLKAQAPLLRRDLR